MIVKPIEIDKVMKKVRKGKLTTVNEIRNVLAKRYGTSIACSMTTGIFVWIAANGVEV